MMIGPKTRDDDVNSFDNYCGEMLRVCVRGSGRGCW